MSRLATDPAFLAHAIASLRVATRAEPPEHMDKFPYPGPPPMSEEAAAWVREHVWTKGMRKTFAAVPDHYLKCACQFGTAYWCQNGQHGRCARGEPLRQWETAVLRYGGTQPAIGVSEVWLADRVCMWRCKCNCHRQHTRRLDKPVQLELFGSVA
jgi:hypothetical protein